ncbi:haloacid dehalogenase superfamily, subfamily IA, variant 3 with third motif having DD or ED [Ruminococcaceae bacterium YRB3002]|nr:haloacid dehalogenase superfamily, subfamily IA, variant 3 with third motif having DD or ED [Ruminococcaceae bacterium YRB3002]
MKYYELTPPQQNIAELNRFYEGTGIATLCGAMVFGGVMDKEILTEALVHIVKKHEALRLRFVFMDGRILQYVEETEPDRPGYLRFGSREEMRGYARREAGTVFEMNGGVMYRMTVFDIPEHTGIILTASHLVTDAWTFSILAREVYEIYGELAEGRRIKYEIQRYTDSVAGYMEYRESALHGKDLDFWASRYSHTVEETPVRAGSSRRDPVSGRFTTTIGCELSGALDGFCRSEKISVTAVIESAMIIYLSKINGGREDITIGVPVLVRTHASEKRIAGMYVATIPLTAGVSKTDKVRDLCLDIYRQHHEVYRHRRPSFADIMGRIRASGIDVSSRLFDVLVSTQNAGIDIDADTEWFSSGFCGMPLELHIDDRDSNGCYNMTLDYQKAVFPDDKEIELLASRITHIIRQIVESDDITVQDITVIPDEEYDLVVRRFNGTEAPYNRTMCVHGAFARAAAESGDRTAVLFRGEPYTYGRIDKMSDALAAFLAGRGIGKGDVVPIISVRDPLMIVAMLAVIKTGAAYMPVSPDYPADRMSYMTDSVNAKIILTCGYRTEDTRAVLLEDIDYGSCAAPHAQCDPDSLCYVIFTSGSTGRPKATAVTHRNVMNYTAHNDFNVHGKVIRDGVSSILSVTDIVFDIFVTETLLALVNGMTIVLADDDEAVSQKLLAALVERTGAEVIQTTPTKMRSYMIDGGNLAFLDRFRVIMLGGEELTGALLTRLRQCTKADIYNVYGPAETTVWSSADLVDGDDIVIGSPVANTRIYVLDDDERPVPAGVMGEIVIGGDGVGRGYINNPELTSERFTPDIFEGEGVMYHTGDLGYRRTDGRVVFCGRRDNQIKLRGQRIELGEIESAMEAYEGVDLAAVVLRKDSRGGQYLAGFFTSSGPEDENELRRFLFTRIPDYMVPVRLVRLDKMPMTQSGKIDRKSLPDTESGTPDDRSRTYDPPVTDREQMLCKLISEITGCEKVGINDDFYAIGGDSLKAMELVSAMSAVGMELPVRKLYECRTVRGICEALDSGAGDVGDSAKYGDYPLPRRNRDRLFFRMFAAFTKICYRFSVSGLDKLDMNERYIFCPNHESNLDIMWVLTALRKVIRPDDQCALIAEEHLDKKLSAFIMRVSGGIPIDRYGDYRPSVARAVRVLEDGERKYLIIHPEGTRTRTGSLGKFKEGAAVIAQKTGVKIVPVYIEGAGRIFPVDRERPKVINRGGNGRFPLRVSFGTPVDPARKQIQQITEEVRSQVLDMKKKNKVILFDWGNIVEKHDSGFSLAEAWNELFGRLGYEGTSTEIFRETIGYDATAITTEAEYEEFYGRLKEDYGLKGDYETFRRLYGEIFARIEYREDVRDYEWSLRERCYTGILSDLALPDVARLDSQVGLGNYDHLFLSCRLGISKPRREFWEAAQRKLPFDKKDVLFIDDNPANTGAAAEFGWNVLCATGNELDLIRETCERFLAT